MKEFEAALEMMWLWRLHSSIKRTAGGATTLYQDVVEATRMQPSPGPSWELGQQCQAVHALGAGRAEQQRTQFISAWVTQAGR